MMIIQWIHDLRNKKMFVSKLQLENKNVCSMNTVVGVDGKFGGMSRVLESIYSLYWFPFKQESELLI